jgi:hypothetical protein
LDDDLAESMGSDKESCGYPDLVLYRLNLVGWDIRNYIRQRWPELAQGGVTRRYNRLEKRIERANSRVRRAGLPGLWKVSYGWEEYKGAVVYAENKAHAKQQAAMFFGPAFAGDDIREVSFVGEGSPLDIAKHNKRSRSDLAGRMKKVEKSLKAYEKEREQLEFLATTHEIYGIQAVAEVE